MSSYDNKLKVTFNSPQSGFMSFSIESGEQSFVTAVSWAPYDSLRDLMVALSSIIQGPGKHTIKWNREPEEYDFVIERHDGDVTFDVARYSGHKRSNREVILHHESALMDLCLPFFEAFEDLQRDVAVDEFDKNWRREFPEKEMKELSHRMQNAK